MHIPKQPPCMHVLRYSLCFNAITYVTILFMLCLFNMKHACYMHVKPLKWVHVILNMHCTSTSEYTGSSCN